MGKILCWMKFSKYGKETFNNSMNHKNSFFILRCPLSPLYLLSFTHLLTSGMPNKSLKANLPFPQPMDKNALPAYLKFKDGVISQLASIQYRSADEVAAVNEKKGGVTKP